MLELYGAPTGNCLRVAVALAESGLPFRTHRLDLRAGDHKAEAYVALNPTGRVPTLVDPDGPARSDSPEGHPLVLTQSNAIMLYIAEKSGALLPRSGLGRIEAVEWWLFAVTDLIAPSNQGSWLKQGDDSTAAADFASRLDGRALAQFEHLERRLGEHRYLGGEAFSLADIAAFTITRWLVPQKTQSLPHLTRWFETVAARPGVIAGLAAFDAPT